ncbi:RDD family protein [Cellulomonas sp. zg-ZUI222]|uniref:RDD family protein n=1 Tax=Cellulomonas wangleii TaxID=2816956 RepID=UPI001A93E66A|nr:RDD family protein [Cellulomonas wangleii]MBO0920457.1 RDD family protein [Cellulomonas wangleii]
MSTRASAPRCASCGMPLAPDAESCAVCGARVPLIARPAVDEDGAGDDEVRPASGAVPVGALPVPPVVDDRVLTASVPTAPTDVLTVVGVATPPAQVADPAGPATPPRYDAAAAARDVRAAGRPPRPEGDGAVPGVGPRVLAYAIDLLLLVVVAVLMVFVVRVTDGAAAPAALVVVPLVGLGQLLAEGLRGATLGAYLTGLRTVDARTGGTPGVPRAFVRQLVVALGSLVAGVGNWVVAASAAWDSSPQRRGWHDRASGTAVVAAGAPSQPSAGPAATRSAATRGAAPRVADARPWTPTPPPGREPVPSAGPPTSTSPATEPSTDGFPAVGAPLEVSFRLPPVAPAEVPVPPAPDLVRPAPTALDPAPAPAAARPDLLPPPPEVGRRERGGARAPVTPAPAAPGLPTEDDLAELEHTRVRDPGTLRRRTGTLALHFDTGERVRVVGRGLVGRGPRAEDGQDILHVVVLSDAARSLSRVHAEFGPEPGEDEGAAIWVSDRGSTNGTVVVDPAGAARVLPAGARAVVRAGWTVRLGDREARVEDD